MATPISDALAKLIEHIKPITDQLGIREVNNYPKAIMERVNPPVIDLVFVNDGKLKNVGQGSSLIIQHPLFFKLYFYSEVLTAEAKHEDCRVKLEAIQDYLIRHMSVDDGYGDLGLSELDDFDSFNLDMGEVYTPGQDYLGGSIDLLLKVLVVY